MEEKKNTKMPIVLIGLVLLVVIVAIVLGGAKLKGEGKEKKEKEKIVDKYPDFKELNVTQELEYTAAKDGYLDTISKDITVNGKKHEVKISLYNKAYQDWGYTCYEDYYYDGLYVTTNSHGKCVTEVNETIIKDVVTKKEYVIIEDAFLMDDEGKVLYRFFIDWFSLYLKEDEVKEIKEYAWDTVEKEDLDDSLVKPLEGYEGTIYQVSPLFGTQDNVITFIGYENNCGPDIVIYKMLIKDGKLGYIYSAKYASEDHRSAYPGQC